MKLLCKPLCKESKRRELNEIIVSLVAILIARQTCSFVRYYVRDSIKTSDYRAERRANGNNATN